MQTLVAYVENKPGVLARLCETFSENKVNIQGLSISDTVDHAVVRLLTSNPKKAQALLEDAGVPVLLTLARLRPGAIHFGRSCGAPEEDPVCRRAASGLGPGPRRPGGRPWDWA